MTTRMNYHDFDEHGTVTPFARAKWQHVTDEIDAQIATQRIRDEVEKRRRHEKEQGS